jgi:hypothetical protein
MTLVSFWLYSHIFGLCPSFRFSIPYKPQCPGMAAISVWRWRGYEEVPIPLGCKLQRQSGFTYERKSVGFPSYPAHLETEIETISENCGFYAKNTRW